MLISSNRISPPSVKTYLMAFGHKLLKGKNNINKQKQPKMPSTVAVNLNRRRREIAAVEVRLFGLDFHFNWKYNC